MANPWELQGPPTTLMSQGLARFRTELNSWYGREEAAGRRPSRVQQLTLGMLGKQGDPDLRLHGAETNWIMPFLLELVTKHGRLLGQRAAAWTTGVVDLMAVVTIIRAHKARAPPPNVVQEFCDHVQSHL